MAKTNVIFLTIDEYRNCKLSEIDDRLYNRIESCFRKLIGDNAKKFLENNLHLTIQKLTATSCIDVMSCITVI